MCLEVEFSPSDLVFLICLQGSHSPVLSSLGHRFSILTNADICASYTNVWGLSVTGFPRPALTRRISRQQWCRGGDSIASGLLEGEDTVPGLPCSPEGLPEAGKVQPSSELIRLCLAARRPSGCRSSPTTRFPGFGALLPRAADGEGLGQGLRGRSEECGRGIPQTHTKHTWPPRRPPPASSPSC